MPAIPMALRLSLKIMTPIKTVANKLNTDQIAPAIESEFFCKIAGSQANVPSE